MSFLSAEECECAEQLLSTAIVIMKRKRCLRKSLNHTRRQNCMLWYPTWNILVMFKLIINLRFYRHTHTHIHTSKWYVIIVFCLDISFFRFSLNTKSLEFKGIFNCLSHSWSGASVSNNKDKELLLWFRLTVFLSLIYNKMQYQDRTQGFI